jgi:hypothetical protein
VPTVVNALSDEAQRCAHAAGTAMVGPEHVRAVIAAAFRSEPAPAVAQEPEPASEAAADARPHAKEKKPKARPAIPEKPKVIATHKAHTTPASAAARVPPPTPRQSTPLPPMSDLDSTSPRVRDWVSRFTDGQSTIRFGARVTPPARETSKAFDPELVPPPTEVSEKELEPANLEEVVEDAAAPKPEAAAPFVERRRPVPVPTAKDKADEAKAEPADDDADAQVEETAELETPKLVIVNGHDVEPPAAKLEIVGLAPEESPVVAEALPVPLEVKAEQLAPPPLQVDEAPAPYTPEPPAPRQESVSASPTVSVRAVAPVPSKPVREPVASKPPLIPEDDDDDEPTLPAIMKGSKSSVVPSLTAADVRPVQSKKQRAAARRAERAARRATEAAARTAEAAVRAAEATARAAEAAARNKSAPEPAAPTRSMPSAPALGAPSSTTIATVLTREPEWTGDGPRSPRHPRLLAGVITGLLVFGVAVAAILLVRRGGLAPTNQETSVVNTPQQVEPAPVPAPVIPVPAQTPDTATDHTSSDPTRSSEDEPAVDRAEAGRWCLVVGSYLYEDRAKQLANKLSKRTKQVVRVVPDGRGSEKAYRIFYGSYATEAAAVRAADRLLARGIVSEAMVERNPD